MVENLNPAEKAYIVEQAFFYSLAGAILDLKAIDAHGAAYRDFWRHLDLHLANDVGNLRGYGEDLQGAIKVLDRRLRDVERRRREYWGSLPANEVADQRAERHRFQAMLESGLERYQNQTEWSDS